MQDLKAAFPDIDAATERLALWAEAMRERNQKINLISRKDIDALQRHLVHCRPSHAT